MDKVFGLQHNAYEPVILFEYNLEDLEWIISLIPWNDSTRKDYQQAIDYLEETTKSQKEYEENMPRLDLVVIDTKFNKVITSDKKQNHKTLWSTEDD